MKQWPNSKRCLCVEGTWNVAMGDFSSWLFWNTFSVMFWCIRFTSNHRTLYSFDIAACCGDSYREVGLYSIRYPANMGSHMVTLRGMLLTYLGLHRSGSRISLCTHADLLQWGNQGC